MSTHHALCRSVGSGIPFSLGAGSDAVTVLLQPMRLVDWGVLEQILLRQRKNSIELYSIPEELYPTLFEAIREDRSVSINELIEYASSQEGASWRLWLSLRREYSYSQCSEWIDRLVNTDKFYEYLSTALQIDGLDLYADLDWPKIAYADEIAAIRGEKAGKNVDWKVFVNSVADAYSIDPMTFGELTYYQARLLLCSKETLTGNMKITKEEAKNLAHLLSARKFYEQKKAGQQNASSPSMESTTG